MDTTNILTLGIWVCKECFDRLEHEYCILTTPNFFNHKCELCQNEAKYLIEPVELKQDDQRP
jgi:hypothetical protein